MSLRLLILFSVCCFSITAYAGTIDTSSVENFNVAGIDHPEDIKNVLDNMKLSVRNGSFDYLINITALPIKAFVNNERIEIFDRVALEKYQSQVFNKKVLDAIEKQNFEGIFVNWRGVMVGSGELWIGRKYNSREVNIIAINNK